LSGDVLVDIPLYHIVDSHNLNDCAMTAVLKELDLTQKGKKSDAEVYDIFGLADWHHESKKCLFGGNGTKSSQKRLVFKTNSAENQDMSLFVKASLLKR